MTNRSMVLKATIQVCLVVLSFLLGGLFMLVYLKVNPVGSKNNYAIIKDNTKVYEKSSLAKSVEKIYKVVVVIEEYEGGVVSGTGTGFIYKTDDRYGYILTNEHVLKSDKTTKLLLSSNEEIDAKILGKDQYLDLAVLQIDKKYVSLVAKLGSSENMNLGDTVFTVGSPLGIEYNGSVTSGILSGKNRLVETSVSKSNNYDWVMEVLQIDAPLNPGNSGGPLLNVNGEVVGVCSMKLVDDNIEGMGFAIPIEYVMSYIKTLEDSVKIKWPVFGVTMENIGDNSVDVPKNVKEGVVIVEVKKDTGAAKSGLQKGDIITKMNGVKVKNSAHLRYELYKYKAGDRIEVTYLRDGKENKTEVLLND